MTSWSFGKLTLWWPSHGGESNSQDLWIGVSCDLLITS